MDKVLFRHQNKEASIPLVIPTTVECNTSEDTILANVLHNSKRNLHWVSRTPAHERVAILCGSGPSIGENIRELRRLRGDIFALNNAANWLHKQGLLADYQIIMDAQPRTVELLGPAKIHLLASMVDPALFDACPDAWLWHSTHGDLMVDEVEGFPRRDEDYCLIGSGITVGNTSLPLLYAMGYRKIHIFGMDSCHKGTASHVLHQSINDGDPCTIVEFMGREYVSSFTMKLQADNFMQRAVALRDAGCAITLHGDGYLQDIWRATQAVSTERGKYSVMWSFDQYRAFSPGEVVAEVFVRVADPKPGQTVIDAGCGTGRGGKQIERLSGASVHYVDFAENCGDTKLLPFTLCDMSWDQLPQGDFVFCADVMEHIPPMDVERTMANICAAAPRVFFQISLVPDAMGDLIGAKLHLSVHPAWWWLKRVSDHGKVAFFKDEGETVLIYLDNSRGE